MSEHTKKKKQDNRITIRLSDSLFDSVQQTANELGISTSDVVRYALSSELRSVSALKRKVMTFEEREAIIKKFYELTNVVNQFDIDNKKLGNNVFQIRNFVAHSISSGSLESILYKRFGYNKDDFANHHKEIETAINEIKSELNDIWRLLQ